jgi:hypothetical protein
MMDSPPEPSVNRHDLPEDLRSLRSIGEENRVKAAEAMSNLRSMYESGAPLFTRQAIQQISQQLKEAGEEEPEKISVTALNGARVDFTISPRSVYEAEDPEIEYHS